MPQFEALARKEANGFTARRRAACMLRVAVEEEQAGGGARSTLVMSIFEARVTDCIEMKRIGGAESVKYTRRFAPRRSLWKKKYIELRKEDRRSMIEHTFL